MFVEISGIVTAIVLVVVFAILIAWAMISDDGLVGGMFAFFWVWLCVLLCVSVTLKYDYIKVDPSKIARAGTYVVYDTGESLISSTAAKYYNAKDNVLYIQRSKPIASFLTHYTFKLESERDIPVENNKE